MGLATEMARAWIAEARARGLTELRAGLDEVNAASLRALEKVGFQRIAVQQGALATCCLRLSLTS